MKLKQIALAAAVVAASSAALADVTVYGIADVNVNNSKAEVGSKPLAALANGFSGFAANIQDPLTATLPSASAQTGQGRIDSSGLSTSRIGFKGSEDLGGGMKASFQLEGKINVDTGENANYDRPANTPNANYFFGRQSWVGLTGSFGTVQLGKTWTAFHDVKGDFEHADNTNLSVTSAVWDAFDGGYDANTANQVKYTLPLSSGLTASIGYAFGENKTANVSANNTVSLGVKYAAGPLAVGYAYQTENGDQLGETKKSRFKLIGGSFDLGAAKLVGSWSDAKTTRRFNTARTTDINNAFNQVTFGALAGAALTTARTQAGNFYRANSKANRYQLGVVFPMGASNLYFGYADSSEDRGGKKIGDANGYVLAATYSLSKRTTAYAGYTTVKATLNKDAVYTGQAQISGKSTKTVAGIRHVF